ncbi:flagellar export protein FliJ [Marinobacterium mangrovicola]|uniref:Flagellar FliJ protein n=1 Tax=Marinobacterium mangrovicola TaxID=1476959 RepID=A0A4R1GIS2_9GAMM|nr:flagellar export protein FliJ [Marinobacterium mangrovicola]TCK07071.1 flagellar FliJ protein [Marinobacterium mangrovicola]
MSKKIDRFQLLLDLAERKRKEMERLLGESQQRVAQAEAGLRQLKQYQLEYQQQFQQAGRSGLSSGGIQTYQAFISKVSATTLQQEQALKQSQAQLEQVEIHWRQAMAHHKAMQKLLDKAVDEQRKLDDKRLQQELDERSQHTRPNFI